MRSTTNAFVLLPIAPCPASRIRSPLMTLAPPLTSALFVRPNLLLMRTSPGAETWSIFMSVCDWPEPRYTFVPAVTLTVPVASTFTSSRCSMTMAVMAGRTSARLSTLGVKTASTPVSSSSVLPGTRVSVVSVTLAMV